MLYCTKYLNIILNIIYLIIRSRGFFSTISNTSPHPILSKWKVICPRVNFSVIPLYHLNIHYFPWSFHDSGNVFLIPGATISQNSSCPRSHRYLAPTGMPKKVLKNLKIKPKYFGPRNHETMLSYALTCSCNVSKTLVGTCFPSSSSVWTVSSAGLNSQLGLERRPTLAPQSSDLGHPYREATKNGEPG